MKKLFVKSCPQDSEPALFESPPSTEMTELDKMSEARNLLPFGVTTDGEKKDLERRQKAHQNQINQILASRDASRCATPVGTDQNTSSRRDFTAFLPAFPRTDVPEPDGKQNPEPDRTRVLQKNADSCTSVQDRSLAPSPQIPIFKPPAPESPPPRRFSGNSIDSLVLGPSLEGKKRGSVDSLELNCLQVSSNKSNVNESDSTGFESDSESKSVTANLSGIASKPKNSDKSTDKPSDKSGPKSDVLHSQQVRQV